MRFFHIYLQMPQLSCYGVYQKVQGNHHTRRGCPEYLHRRLGMVPRYHLWYKMIGYRDQLDNQIHKHLLTCHLNSTQGFQGKIQEFAPLCLVHARCNGGYRSMYHRAIIIRKYSKFIITIFESI